MTDELDLLRAHMEGAPVPTDDELARMGRSLHAAMDDESARKASRRTTRLQRSRHDPSRRLVWAGVAAVVVVAVAGALGVAAVSRGNSKVSSPPFETMAWRLVTSSTSPFRSLPPGGQTDLQCVSDVVCYSPGADSDRLFRTTDGGRSWHPTAPIPGEGKNGGPGIEFSCSGVETCAVLESNNEAPGDLGSLVVTTDSGSKWSSSTIPSPRTAIASSAPESARTSPAKQRSNSATSPTWRRRPPAR